MQIIAFKLNHEVYAGDLPILTGIVLNYWYFHGKLEDDIGYDKGLIINSDYIKHFGYWEEFVNEGIYDVEVIGINKPCIGYFWQANNRTRGLVCYKDDQKAINHIKEKFNSKSYYI